MDTKPQSSRESGTGGSKGPNHRIAIDLMDDKPKGRTMIPVWFFVGLILLVYGILILVTGISEFSNLPATVLSNLHPAIWWGALLTVIGALYVYLYMPKRS
jgi:hypothetical protein